MKKMINDYEFILSEFNQVKEWISNLNNDNYRVSVLISDEYFVTNEFLDEVNLWDQHFFNRLIKNSEKAVEPIARVFFNDVNVKIRVDNIDVLILPDTKIELRFDLYFGEDSSDVDMNGLWRTRFINRDELCHVFRSEY